MAFNRGMIGVAIVLVSLFGSVALGVLTNIDTKTVTKDVDEYVADITGGFTYDRDKSYTNYNPSSNYNGYTNPITSNFPVDFEPSNYTNNYPMSYSGRSGTSSQYTTATSFERDGTASWLAHPGYKSYSQSKSQSLDDGERTYLEEYVIGGPRSAGGGEPKNYIKLSTILNSCISDGRTVLGANPSTITIDIPYTVKNITVPFPYTYITPNQRSATLYYVDNNVVFAPITYQPVTGVIIGPFSQESEIPQWYSQAYLSQIGVGNTYNITIKYTTTDNSNMLFSAYIGDSLIYSGSANDYYIIYDTSYYYWRNSGYQWGGSSSIYPAFNREGYELLPDQKPFNISVNYFADTYTEYIDTRYGIGIRNNETVTWNNNQQNGITTLSFSVWDSTSKQFVDTGNYSNTAILKYKDTTETDTITISRISGHTYISLNNAQQIDLGTWTQTQLEIDNVSGKLIAYPINTWNNFNNYSLFGTSISIGSLHKDILLEIEWSANSSFRLSVINTQVFFNTYGVVMIDPSITIANLWPEYNRYVVSLSKVATIGDSITIGNSTYPIENGNVIINNTKISVTDMNIRYQKDNDQWEVIVESEKNSANITVPNTYLGFGGTWYFTAGFYEIVSKQVQERVWDILSYNWVESNMFFWMMIIIALLSVVAYKMQLLDGMSIGILICAEVILMLIGGTT